MRHPFLTATLAIAAALTLAHAVLAQSPESQPAAPSPSQPAALPSQDRAEPLPPELEGVRIVEHLDARLPLDAEFVAHDGRTIKLGDLFDGKRPVILTLNYFKCPMLCGLMLNSLNQTLRQMEWTVGEQFQVITVSFDPLETHQLAALKRQNYLAEYGRAAAAGGWHFLTGRQAAIDRLLSTTGFGIRWSEEKREWMHVAALIICTPDGRISRYLVDLVYDPQTVRLSLVEAGEGKIGSPLDHILLFCYHYDGEGYSLAAMNLVRAGGGLTLVAVGALLSVLWRRERRRKASPATT